MPSDFHKEQTEYILVFAIFFVSIATHDWAVTQSAPCLCGKETERHLLWCGFSKLHWSRNYGHAASQACSLSVSLLSAHENNTLLNGILGLLFTSRWCPHNFFSACGQETQGLDYFQLKNIVGSNMMSEVRKAKCYCHQPIQNHMLPHIPFLFC